MAATGRNPKLTPAAAEAIIKGVASGLAREDAARCGGVTIRTLQRWLARGRTGDPLDKDDKPFVSLFAGVQAAEVKAIRANVATILKAAAGVDELTEKRTRLPDGTHKIERTKRRVVDWKAAAWWLEHLHPDNYGSDKKRVRELEKRVDELLRQLGRAAGATAGGEAEAGGPTAPPAGGGPGG
jgi:hypothetical protein